MRYKRPERKREIIDFVSSYYKEHHRSPSISEIAHSIGVAKSTVHGYLIEMNNENTISYDGRTIETVTTGKFNSGYFYAPLVGSICCGTPTYEEENIENYVSLPEVIFGKGEFFILRAHGDSMIDSDINEGDLVVIRKQETASVGNIVVALDENGENTLKKFSGFDPDTNEAILEYKNQSKYPNKVIKVKKLVIQGVAKSIIKTL